MLSALSKLRNHKAHASHGDLTQLNAFADFGEGLCSDVGAVGSTWLAVGQAPVGRSSNNMSAMGNLSLPSNDIYGSIRKRS